MQRSSGGRAAILAFVLLAGGALHASPTPNEFQACHQLGAALLRNCLDEAPGRLDAACWQTSRERTTACYSELRGAGARDQERAEAARRARQGALRQDPATPAPGAR